MGILEYVHQAVADRVTPGGVLAHGGLDGDPVIIPFGTTEPGPDGRPVTAATLYDIASLTKPLATTAVLMHMVGTGELALERPAIELIPELVGPEAEHITLAHLAGHAAGFPAHVPFYERLWAGDRAGASSAREALVRMAATTPRPSAPGQRALYSDLGYILLAAALERAGGARLDALVAERVTGPLAMTATRFVDLEAVPIERPEAAPTERCDRRGLVRGEVHDENAHAAGGICGHAGLFATAGDVAAFGRAILAATAGRAGAGFEPEVVRRFLATAAAPATTWRLGWDTPSPEPGISHAGDRWPRDGVGHLGFTGTSLWLDPGGGRYAVLLTNRVHPTRAGTGIKELRRAVMDAVVESWTARSR